MTDAPHHVCKKKMDRFDKLSPEERALVNDFGERAEYMIAVAKMAGRDADCVALRAYLSRNV